MRVQILIHYKPDSLAEMINNYLISLEKEGWEVHDIKYSISCSGKRSLYSALLMVMYKPK